MCRNTYIVCYDIGDDKRRNVVANICKGYGERIQYSVFECPLTLSERHQLRACLLDEIHHDEDQILLIDLGPTGGRARSSIHALGQPHISPDQGPAII